jgi:low affinity Fe/Cu permease
VVVHTGADGHRGWAAAGPLFGFSEHRQLIVNSFTTIVTFLTVFIIQNTLNRDFKALQLKLDELLRSSENAQPGLVNLHNVSDDDMQRLEKAFEKLSGKPDIEGIVRVLEKSSSSRGPRS